MTSCVLRLVLRVLLNWHNAESICRKVGEKLRRPALHASMFHCGTYSVRIKHLFTLTDSYTHFLPKTQPDVNFMSRPPKFEPYIITLPKYTVLKHWWIVLLLCWSRPCFITLLSYIQQFHLAELYPILTHCRGIPYLLSLLSNSNFISLLSYTQS